jgi:hypothetical protein
MFHQIFFRKPHIRRFRADPSDDAEIHLEMDELRSTLNQEQIELRESLKDNKVIPHEIQNMNSGFYHHYLNL